ncbi:hypothetical protein D3C76_1044880 [compost metagenome]
MGLAHLANLSGNGHRGADDQQVVNDPQTADQRGADFIARPVEQTPYRKTQADDIQQRQHQVRPGDTPVELVFSHQAALGGHVEFAFLGVEQGNGGRPRDVPGEHGFIDLSPERQTVFSLHA